MMQTQQSLFEIELTKLVASEVDRMKDILAFNNFSDVSQFKYVMGVITGLKSINDLVDIV